MSIIQIACGAVSARLHNSDRQARLITSTVLSYAVEGAEFSDAYKANHWDGRSTFFDHKTGMFPAGFLHLVHSTLTNRGYTVQIIRKPLPKPLGSKDAKVDDFPDDPRYDFQAETVESLLKHGQMIAQVATGGGKSRIARLAYERIRRPTLFITTRSVLMYQMKDSFEESLGKRVGVMGDSEWSPTKGFNVAMVQTLAARIELKTYSDEISRRMELLKSKEEKEITALKKKYAIANRKKSGVAYLKVQAGELASVRDWHKRARPTDKELADDVKVSVDKHNARRKKVVATLEQFEFVILEEAHEAGSNSFYDVMRQCRNAHYRLSLTATPFMKDGEESNMRLMACSGPIGIRVSEKMLIDSGILAKPFFKYVKPIKPSNLYNLTAWQRAYKLGIVESDARNRHIVWEATRAKDAGLPVMTLVVHKAHGKVLEKLMKEAGIEAVFIDGSSKQVQRQSALNKLGSGEIDVLIGSIILDVGVDVPSVGMIILAGGGKAEVSLRQRVGRGLRAKKNGPNVAFILDFSDEDNTHLLKHSVQRRRIIEGTPGFMENILAPGEDFDYAQFGNAAA